jgi:hypothetical protein
MPTVRVWRRPGEVLVHAGQWDAVPRIGETVYMGPEHGQAKVLDVIWTLPAPCETTTANIYVKAVRAARDA